MFSDINSHMFLDIHSHMFLDINSHVFLGHKFPETISAFKTHHLSLGILHLPAGKIFIQFCSKYKLITETAFCIKDVMKRHCQQN